MLESCGSTGCGNTPPSLTINRNGAATMAKAPNTPTSRNCEACGSPYGQKIGVSRAQFLRSRACSRGCAARLGTRRRPDPLVRLYAKLDKGPGKGPWGTCWVWMGHRDRFGYGRLNWSDFDTAIAHRVSYQLHHGPIANGLEVRHRCDNPACCNPDHLELGTPDQNTQDKIIRGRQMGPRGERAPSAKLTAEQAREIFVDPRRYREIAKSFGVSRAAVSAIKTKRNWRHLWSKK
jgi:hypothetical protein